MHALTCPSCSRPFRPADVNTALGIATCGACAQVFRLDGAEQSQLQTPTAPRVPLPEKFVVEETPGELHVRWRWFTPVTLFLIPFALGWNAFLVGWYALAFSGVGGDSGGEPFFGPRLIMLVFPVAHVAVGVGLGYSVLTGLFNSTRLTVAHNLLQIRHGPLPWLGGGTWERAELAQLFVEEETTRNRGSTFRLSAVLRDGRQVPLLKGLREKAQARWLEQALEGRMRIEDRPVAGEASR